MAQKEYIKNPSPSNLAFEVLQRSGTNPIIQVDEFDKIIEFRNIDWDNKKEDSIKLYKILSQIKKENDPITIQYENEKGELKKAFQPEDKFALRKKADSNIVATIANKILLDTSFAEAEKK